MHDIPWKPAQRPCVLAGALALATTAWLAGCATTGEPPTAS
ncbi:MAG: hypothetical protein RIQ97_646, partial [Pseudomonadota bacterium]